MVRPSLVVILSDGIRGHLHQSRGVAHWIAEATGADVVERDVPRLSGMKRFLLMKVAARKLRNASTNESRRWLDRAGAGDLLADLENLAAEKGASQDAAGGEPPDVGKAPRRAKGAGLENLERIAEPEIDGTRRAGAFEKRLGARLDGAPGLVRRIGQVGIPSGAGRHEQDRSEPLAVSCLRARSRLESGGRAAGPRERNR